MRRYFFTFSYFRVVKHNLFHEKYKQSQTESQTKDDESTWQVSASERNHVGVVLMSWTKLFVTFS